MLPSRAARSTRSSPEGGAYTVGSARAEFAEAEKGSLERGKLADFVLLDRDLTRIPAETIRDARVMMTVVGGQVVFDRATSGDGR